MTSCKCDDIGKRRHKVTVKKPVYTQDAANEQIPSYVEFFKTSFAFCRAMSTREVVQSEQVQGSVGWVVEFNWGTKPLAITSDMKMTLHSFGNREVSCDGPAMPIVDDGGFPTGVKVRAMEQTA